MFALRGIVSFQKTMRELGGKLTPELAGDLWRAWRGTMDRSWHVDGTDFKVDERWCYVYRAIDGSGALAGVVV